MSFRVLFVCAANICRSPTAVRIFASDLPENLAEVIDAESAGTVAEPGRPWCAESQRWVAHHGVAVDGGPEHHSRRLTGAKVGLADLVLAADTNVRGVVLRTLPSARGRLFTLIEAATLATAVQEALVASRDHRPGSGLLRLETIPQGTGAVRMEWLVAEMDAARGLVVMQESERGRSGGIDLVDPHGPGVKTSHRAALRMLAESTRSLSHSMSVVNSQ